MTKRPLVRDLEAAVAVLRERVAAVEADHEDLKADLLGTYDHLERLQHRYGRLLQEVGHIRRSL
jgi:hypothetical protein